MRQDFIAYYTDTGRLEIETPIEKERELMRDTFALSFLGEADFFSGANAAVAIDLSVLKASDFALPTNEGHTALLKELTFKLAQTHGPTFHIRSKDVLTTLDLNLLRPKLATAVEVKSAVISISFGTGKRPKRVTLTKKNSMSFSRATHAAETLVTQHFRSVCPVTGQPDYATIAIAYRGAAIDHAALHAYLVAFRRHPGFHEHCVERIFADVTSACAPDALAVSARFTRRGGIDISPWRRRGDAPLLALPTLVQ